MVKVIKIGPNDAKIFELKYNSSPKTFMAITHPNCIHCINIKPELEKLYSNVKKSSEDINFINVHGDTFQKVKSKLPSDFQDIQGYPSLLTSFNGNIEEYDGPRNFQNILDHCIKKLKITDPEIINIIKSGGRKKRKTKKHKSKNKSKNKYKNKSRNKSKTKKNSKKY